MADPTPQDCGPLLGTEPLTWRETCYSHLSQASKLLCPQLQDLNFHWDVPDLSVPHFMESAGLISSLQPLALIPDSGPTNQRRVGKPWVPVRQDTVMGGTVSLRAGRGAVQDVSPSGFKNSFLVLIRMWRAQLHLSPLESERVQPSQHYHFSAGALTKLTVIHQLPGDFKNSAAFVSYTRVKSSPWPPAGGGEAPPELCEMPSLLTLR